MKSKIAIFGGSFDPPTLAHQIMGQVVFAETKVAQVWYMPCGNHQLKSPIAKPWSRWQMCQRMVESMGDQFVASDFEIKNDTSGKMYDTLHELRKSLSETYPAIVLCPVIGMDCANDILKKWYKGKQLIEEFEFIVVGRYGVKEKANWFHEKPHKFIKFGWDCSSTRVRDLFSKNKLEKAKKLLNPRTWTYAKIIYGPKNEI